MARLGEVEVVEVVTVLAAMVEAPDGDTNIVMKKGTENRHFLIKIPWRSNKIFCSHNTILGVLLTDSVNCFILLLALLVQTVKTLTTLRRFLLSRTLSTVPLVL